jgi:carbon-monoxide dehydrogenase small subunit
VLEVLSSNLCRCTGGAPIVAAVLAAQRELEESAQ